MGMVPEDRHGQGPVDGFTISISSVDAPCLQPEQEAGAQVEHRWAELPCGLQLL